MDRVQLKKLLIVKSTGRSVQVLWPHKVMKFKKELATKKLIGEEDLI